MSAACQLTQLTGWSVRPDPMLHRALSEKVVHGADGGISMRDGFWARTLTARNSCSNSATVTSVTSIAITASTCAPSSSIGGVVGAHASASAPSDETARALRCIALTYLALRSAHAAVAAGVDLRLRAERVERAPVRHFVGGDGAVLAHVGDV